MYDFNKTLDTLLKHYPEYSNEINLVFNNIDYNYILFENKEVSKYLIDLKEKEFNIYLLSDLSVDSYKSNSQFNFFNYINGGVYSFQVGSTKPNDNNYIELLDKYSLIADETIFIDDSLKNIEAANKFGIHGIQFTTLDEVKDKVNLLTNKKNAN